MKKTVTVLLGAALCVAAASCAEGPKTSLTDQEKAAGSRTAEGMWKGDVWVAPSFRLTDAPCSTR